MRPEFFVLAVIAAAVPALPASAQTAAPIAGFTGSAAFAGSGSSGVTVHRGAGFNGRVIEGNGNSDGRNGHRRRNGDYGYAYSDLRDGYDINRSWASDSYNDWWHDNPNHSQPAWVRNNQNCDRQYFAGDVLRC